MLTIDYDLFKDKLNALNAVFFEATDKEQALPILAIHQILKECEVSEWIPITFSQANDEEYEAIRAVYRSYYSDIPRKEAKVYDCRMPDDGQEVLITTSWGAVCEDTFHADDVLAGFEDHDDPYDVIAWMPKPKAYKKGGAK